MRRVLLAIGGTVAGLLMLLSFKSHTSAGLVSAAAGAGPSSPRPYGQASAAASPTAGSAGSSSGIISATGARQITGNVASTAYGPVQIQVTLVQNKISKVTVLEQPESTEHDIQIGDFAFPKLIQETLTAQSARIDSVSGATYTSAGYIKSLQSILDNGA